MSLRNTTKLFLFGQCGTRVAVEIRHARFNRFISNQYRDIASNSISCLTLIVSDHVCNCLLTFALDVNEFVF